MVDKLLNPLNTKNSFFHGLASIHYRKLVGNAIGRKKFAAIFLSYRDISVSSFKLQFQDTA